MAALDPATTDRYYLDYEGPMGKRTMQFRAATGTSQGSVVTSIITFINNIKSAVYTSVTFNALRFSNTGSNVSNPLVWTPISGTVAGTLAPENYPRYIDFVGRSVDGRRVRLYVYGCNFVVTDDYRIQIAEQAVISQAVNYLNSAQSLFTTISGSVPVWKAYANSGYNSYHQKKRRQAA